MLLATALFNGHSLHEERLNQCRPVTRVKIESISPQLNCKSQICIANAWPFIIVVYNWGFFHGKPSGKTTPYLPPSLSPNVALPLSQESLPHPTFFNCTERYVTSASFCLTTLSEKNQLYTTNMFFIFF